MDCPLCDSTAPISDKLCLRHLAAFAATGKPDAAKLLHVQLERGRERRAARALGEDLTGAKEKDRQTAIFDLLFARKAELGLQVERINSGEAWDERGEHPIHLARSGTPDILGGVRLLPGLVAGGRTISRELGLEVKSANGKLRPSQRTWAVAALARGAYYAIVRTPAEALGAVEAARRGDAPPPLPPPPKPRAVRARRSES